MYSIKGVFSLPEGWNNSTNAHYIEYKKDNNIWILTVNGMSYLKLHVTVLKNEKMHKHFLLTENISMH